MKKFVSIFFCFALLLSACKNDSVSPEQPKTIDELVRGIAKLSDPPIPQNPSVVKSETVTSTDPQTGQEIACVEKTYSMARNMNDIVAFDPNAANLWPGAIVQGREVPNGILSSIGSFSRTPVTITMSGIGSREVSIPSNSTVSDAIRDLLPQSQSNAVANVSFAYKEMYSKEQAMLDLGVDANWFGGIAKISSKFDKSTDRSKNSIVMMFTQAFYTVSVQEKTKPSDWFQSTVTANDLATTVSDNNPPGYVSSVTYGRLILVKMTSSYSMNEMKSAVAGSFLKTNGGFKYENSQVAQQSEFDVVILGGSAQNAVDAVAGMDINGFKNLITQDANFSKTNPGLPISYRINYLKDNTLMKLGKSTEYKIQDCSVVKDFFNVFISRFDIIDDGSFTSDGKFFYIIRLKDKNGNVVDNENGEPCEIVQNQFDYQKVASGNQLSVVKQFMNFGIPRGKGEQFSIIVELYDYDADTDKEIHKAGSGGLIYTSPFNITTDWQTINLSENGYKSNFIFRIEKK